MKTIKSVLAVSLVGLGIGLTTISSNAKEVSNSNYYSSITNVSNGSLLADELFNLIGKDTKSISYSSLYSVAYPKTDVLPGTNIVFDIYSNQNYDLTKDSGASASSEGVGFNREHTVPQSWFSKAAPMVSDIFHIYPTDIYVNNQRGSYVFDDVSRVSKTYSNGSCLGKGTIYSNKTVFEVADEYKGDIARGYFYMAIRYKDKLASFTAGEAQNVFQKSYPYLTENARKVFTKWSHLDPVSDKEMLRNEAIYGIQNNRNPFIDHPEYIDVIWTNSYSDYKTNTQYNLNNVNEAINALSSSSAIDTIYSAYNKYCRLTVKDKENVSNSSKLFKYVEEISNSNIDLDSFWNNTILKYNSIYNGIEPIVPDPIPNPEPEPTPDPDPNPILETNSISINKFTKTADSLDNYISYKASKGKSQTVPAIYNNQIKASFQ